MPCTSEIDYPMHTPSSIHLASYGLLSSCYLPGTVFSARDRVVGQTDGGAGPLLKEGQNLHLSGPL